MVWKEANGTELLIWTEINMKNFNNLRAESTVEYGKSLRKIANDKKLKAISKKDKETLAKIADLLAKANEEFQTEALSDKEKKKRLDMIKKAVEKINKNNADKAKKDALRMMKDSGMFDESYNLDEGSPLVMSDMETVNAIVQKIMDDMHKLKIKGQFEKAWPKVQVLAKMAGYGVTKSGQNKGNTFRYDLKR